MTDQERVDALYEHERRTGVGLVAGVDEAGRGPLAGPVVVAAVILPPRLYLPKLNDSKKLTPRQRDKLFDAINAQAIAVNAVIVDAATIDRLNILQATLGGMCAAVRGLSPQPQHVLVDGNALPPLPMPTTSIVKGDAKSASIAAASVIAKVTRDRLMLECDARWPQYGFARHKGYGTAAHMAALREFGPCPIHRRSFEPVKGMVAR